ncbi:MAG: hypothetical protein AB7N76_03635 [Planctomycetota bacterium]
MTPRLVPLVLISCAGLALAQQGPQTSPPLEDPLWPRELREQGRRAEELRLLKERVRAQERELQRIRGHVPTLAADDQDPTPPEAPALPAPAPDQSPAPQPQGEEPQPAHPQPAQPRPERPRAPASRAEPEPRPAPRAAPRRAEPAPELDLEEPTPIRELGLDVAAGTDRTLTQRLRGDESRDIAQGKRDLAERLLGGLLGAPVLGALPPERRVALRDALLPAFRDPRLASGRLPILRVKVNLGEALDRLLDALGIDGSTFPTFVALAHGFRAPTQRAGAVAESALTDTLQRFRLRRVQRPADAGLVVAIRGGVAFEPFPGESAQAQVYRGSLRCQGVTGRAYHRDSATVVSHFNLSSFSERKDAFEADVEGLHEPWVASAEAISAQAEHYARDIGRAVGLRVARALLLSHCRSTQGKVQAPAPAPVASQPAPPPAQSAAPEPAGERYQLRFRIGEDEAEEIVGLLRRKGQFRDWELVALEGDEATYRANYAGRGVVLRLREALAELSIHGVVRKRGEVLTIRQAD